MSNTTLPGLMGEYTDEELNAKVVAHAKYFTVVQVNRGGFVRGGSNYDRYQVDTLPNARTKAAELYELDKTRGILIYAVADFAGANGFSRPIENYPKLTYMSKSDKARQDKEQRTKAREMARAARLNLGEKKPQRVVVATEPVVVQEAPTDVPEWFDDYPEALAMFTED